MKGIENKVEINGKQVEYNNNKYELESTSEFLEILSLDCLVALLKVVFSLIDNSINTISFKNLCSSMYNYSSGTKAVNIYKQRIIERALLKDGGNNRDISISTVKVHGGIANILITLSDECKKMIDFCTIAEKSESLTYRKCVNAILDTLELRKDEFDRLGNEKNYLNIMNNSNGSTKESIIQYAVGEKIVDVGSGGGILLDMLEEKLGDKKIIGTDISEYVISELTKRKESESHRWEIRKHNFYEEAFDSKDKVDTIVFSSVLHEIYSYTEDGKHEKFSIDSVKKTLKHAYESLNKGGRIIIRDGVKTENTDKLLRVHFKDEYGLKFFKRYNKDFKGLKDITKFRPFEINENKRYVTGDINFMREFLYTYTWGKDSYPYEVREQFGYFTLKEYVDFLKEIGFTVIEAKEFLETGYKEHLSSLVDIEYYDRETNTCEIAEFPNSNCIIIVEKT